MNLYYRGTCQPKYTTKYGGHNSVHFSNLPCNVQKHIRKLQRIYPSYNWRKIYDTTTIVGVYTLEEHLKAIQE